MLSPGAMLSPASLERVPALAAPSARRLRRQE